VKLKPKAVNKPLPYFIVHELDKPGSSATVSKIAPSLERFEVFIRGLAMSIVAPKGRKHLSADALFRLVQSGFARIPDYRSDDTEISLTDALMSAFAMFSLKSPSLLAFDQERTEGNVHTIYGIERAPCDTYMGLQALAAVNLLLARFHRIDVIV
jgi:hypothetical protein